jgi:hypothetical protein
LPLEAGTGETPHSDANAALERSRSGVVAAGGQQLCSALDTDAADGEQVRPCLLYQDRNWVSASVISAVRAL